MPGSNQLRSIEHVVVLMLENRSFDHMLGFLYADAGNVSPAGQPFEGLTGDESNPDDNGDPVRAFKIQASTPNAYFMPGSDPGEGYAATSNELFGNVSAPTPLDHTSILKTLEVRWGLPALTAREEAEQETCEEEEGNAEDGEEDTGEEDGGEEDGEVRGEADRR